MPTHVLRAALLTLAVALIAWAPAGAESPRRAGIVTAVSGTATVTRANLQTPRALHFRDDVMLHDRIATGDQSIARILLGGKAVITVRERSVVTITQSPRISTVDVESGKVALAVAKERMQPGDSIDLRTPNAVAGIRGTVVIAEVSRKGAATATRFTLLTGLIEVARLDAARRPLAPAAFLTPMQSIVIDGALSPVRPITRSEGASASAEFGIPMKMPARSGPEWVANDQVTQAAALIDPDRARPVGGDPDKTDKSRGGSGDDDRGRGKDNAAGSGSASSSTSGGGNGSSGASNGSSSDGSSSSGSGSGSSSTSGVGVSQDVKPDKGGKASQDPKPDKVKGPPIGTPTTPIVPPSALQASGDGKSKGGKGKGGRD